MQIDTYESNYAMLVKDVLTTGTERMTRNAVTKSVFGRTLRVNPVNGQFPILSGRRMFYKGVLGELAAFLKGPKALKDFEDQGCNYWKKWAKEDGSIELDYGNAWLDFGGVNQLQELVRGLKEDPFGRRHIVTGWRPDRISGLSLPCCHLLYQWYVADGALDMMWYQRSVDLMLGLPSDVMMAYVFNHLVANEVGLEPGEIVMALGDTHVYGPHYEGAWDYVRRMQLNPEHPLPTHSPIKMGLSDFDPRDITLEGYAPLAKIDFELIA